MCEQTNTASKGFVVIVDDIPKNLQLLRQTLRNEGYRVAAVSDREQVLPKIAFTLFIGHDLRSPINVILGLSELLLSDFKDGEVSVPVTSRHDLRIFNVQHSF